MRKRTYCLVFPNFITFQYESFVRWYLPGIAFAPTHQVADRPVRGWLVPPDKQIDVTGITYLVLFAVPVEIDGAIGASETLDIQLRILDS